MLNPDYIFLIFVALLQAAVLVILIRGKFHRQFPYFCFYISYSITMSALRCATLSHPRLYFVLFWITEGLSGVLELICLHEAFRPSLYYESYRWTRLLPPSIILIILGCSLYQAAYHPVGHGPLVRLAAGAYSFEIGVRILEVAIFVLTLRLARRRYHRISRIQPFGIVMGFGIAASSALLADLVGFKFGFKSGSIFEIVFRYLPSTAYMVAAFGWLFTFLVKEPDLPKPNMGELDQRLDEQMQILEWIRKHGPFRSSGLRLKPVPDVACDN
jgi:hypothetical protein